MAKYLELSEESLNGLDSDNLISLVKENHE